MKKVGRRAFLAVTLVLVVQLLLGSAGAPQAAQPRADELDALEAGSELWRERAGYDQNVQDPDSPAGPPDGERSGGPDDLLAAALVVGLNEAWYFEQGYADGRIEPPPVAPALFPSPTPAPPIQLVDGLDHVVFLPLVARAEIVEEVFEARALWVTRWDFSSEADVRVLIANAAGAGFNMILFQVRGTADAFYTPGLEPWAARLSGTLGQHPGWDPLQTAVDAAHAHGLELHAYLNVYPVWVRTEEKIPPEEMAPSQSAHPQHLFWTLSHRPGERWDAWRAAHVSAGPISLQGRGYVYATPAILEMDERVAAVAIDIVNRYAVDGIHLDYVRYPGRDYSYDPTTEAALAQGTISRADWQRQRVSALVSRVYWEAAASRPGLMLSASVWPVYKDHWGWGFSQGYSDFYQDSQGWMKAGVIDAILPMIYPVDVIASPNTFTADQFALLVGDFLVNNGGRHVFPGISAQYDNFDEIAHRIGLARQLGAPGHAIFSARLVSGNYWCADRYPCHDPYWHHFAAGPYATEARVPPLSWRP